MLRSRLRDIQPDVPVSEHPAQANPGWSGGVTSYDALVGQRVVRGSVHRDDRRGVQLVRWFWRHRHLRCLGSPDRVSAFSGPGTRPGIRPVSPRRPAGELALLPRFPAAFRLPAFASRSSDSAEESGPPHGRLPGNKPDLDGVTAFRTQEHRPGWAPSGPAVLIPDRSHYPAGTRHFAAISPCAGISHRQGSRLTRHQRGFKQFARPVFPSPVAAPDGTGRPWTFPRASHPADHEPDNARRGGDTPSHRSPIQ
jgi:hypothetical protein